MKPDRGAWMFRGTAIALSLILIVLFAWLIVVLRNGTTAVTAYEYPYITTNIKPLCPGDKVIYDQVAHIDHTPAAILVVETVWSADDQRTIIPDRHPFYVNIPKPLTGRGHTEWTVPDLPAGHYELRRSTTALGRQTEMFVVTFTVVEGCPNGK